MDKDDCRDAIAKRIHNVYVPDDPIQSWIYEDWIIALEIVELQAELEKRRWIPVEKPPEQEDIDIFAIRRWPFCFGLW